jgi:tetratricopeptide (TPR) repeat protein
MRRLNVKLAVWLVAIAVVSTVGVHFLHGYQIGRNANVLKVQAEQAKKDGNINEAISKYNQYLRHRDDREGYKELSELVVKVAKEPGATNRDKFRAYTILEEAIRRHPDLDGVRTSLIDYTMMMRRFADAQSHIDELHSRGQTDPELDYKAAVCKFMSQEEDKARADLCKMVGYDPTLKQFAAERPKSADVEDAFVFLAQILAKTDEAEADTVMRQLVTWNPESDKAHLLFGRYLFGLRQDVPDDAPDAEARRKQLATDGRKEFEKAVELDPKNADNVIALATAALMEKDYKTAEELLERARKEHPDRQDVYVGLSELAMVRGDRDKATEQLEAGLKHASNSQRILEQLVEVQFQNNDLDAVRATCAKMRENDAIPLESIKFQEARLKLAEGKFAEATRDFEQVRPAMERLGTDAAMRVNTALARCYEILGLSDRQLEIYEELLRTYPNLVAARIGQASALQALGRHPEAETSLTLLTGAAHLMIPEQQAIVLQLVVNQEMSKPAESRNWESAEKIVGLLEKDPKRSPVARSLMRAELLMAEGRDDEARELLMTMRKEHPKEVPVWMALGRLMSRDEKARARLPELLALAEKEVGDPAPFRTEKLSAALRAPGEKKPEDLKKLEEQINELDKSRQQGLKLQLGAAYYQAGAKDEGRRVWQSVLADDPSNARLRQLLYESAQEQRDTTAMEELCKEMRESRHFGENNALYKYCDASRRLYEFSVKRQADRAPLTEDDRKTLADIRKQIDEAIAQRSTWAPLHRVRAEVDQLEGNIDGAIASYQRSLQYSRVRQNTVARRLVTLLYAARRYGEANDATKYLAESEGPDDMRRLLIDLQSKRGEGEVALQMAREDVEKDPKDPSNHMTLGQLLERGGKTEEAEAAYRKATEVGPELAMGWELLIARLMGNRKTNDAVDAVRQASQSIKDPLIIAKLCQIAQDLKQAEQLYLSALSAKPDDLEILRQVADFYAATNQHDKAMGYLDQMIEKGGKSKEKNAPQFVGWARRRKAVNLSQFGDYARVREAVDLIKQNAKGGKPAQSDLLGIIELLANRQEHDSRLESIAAFETLRAGGALSPRQLATLSTLYDREGRWKDSKEQMLAAINAGNDDPAILLKFAEMLINHDEAEEATRYVERSEELIAKSPTPIPDDLKESAVVLKARLLAKEGKSAEAAQLMEGTLMRPLPQNQLTKLGRVAQLMEAMELYKDTERLLSEYMSQDVRGAIALAAFKGRRGQVPEAFTLLQEARRSQTAIDVLSVSMEILRYYPQEVTPERCQLIEGWAKESLEAEADKDRIKLLLGELYEIQGRYDDVVKIYRAILADPKAGLGAKAVAQNNLAFLLAAVDPTPEKASEALQLIDQSIRVLGPRPDLLDTRAMAYLAMGKVEQAATDVRIAAADVPNCAKYYHLAKIEKQLGNQDAAREAMKKAVELRGDHNPFTPAERKDFEKLQQELN